MSECFTSAFSPTDPIPGRVFFVLSQQTDIASLLFLYHSQKKAHKASDVLGIDGTVIKHQIMKMQIKGRGHQIHLTL